MKWKTESLRIKFVNIDRWTIKYIIKQILDIHKFFLR